MELGIREWVRNMHLAGGEHLALFFTVDEAVVVLHRDERREFVGDGIVCRDIISDKRRGDSETYFAWRGLRYRGSAENSEKLLNG